MRQRLLAVPGERLIFFASGRDQPAQTIFESAFKGFLRGIKDALTAGAPYKVIVGVHPACSGAMETDNIKEMGLRTFVRAIKTVDSPTTDFQFSTNELMVAADKVLTWNSTSASLLALSPKGAGKVMFISTQGLPEIFAAVQAGLAQQATSSNEVTRFLLELGDAHIDRPPPSALIPRHAVATMADKIEEAIEASHGRLRPGYRLAPSK